MAILANITILSSGMGIGFPAITLQILEDKNDPMALNEDQASWFGWFLLLFVHFFIFEII